MDREIDSSDAKMVDVDFSNGEEEMPLVEEEMVMGEEEKEQEEGMGLMKGQGYMGKLYEI